SAITAHKTYEVIAISAEVNPDTGEIVHLDCTLATGLARRFVSELAIGYKLGNDIDELVERLEARYYGSARKALIAAFKSINEKYLEWKVSQQQGLPASSTVPKHI
ncbi:MAG: DUF3870 domain-containing protein, partial [Thermoactinomyces sp.]